MMSPTHTHYCIDVTIPIVLCKYLIQNNNNNHHIRHINHENRIMLKTITTITVTIIMAKR